MRVKGKAVRILKRVMGEMAGGVLMEYVVLGLLVVAAVAAAVIMFGKSIKGGLDTMSDSIVNPKDAEKTLTDARKDVKDQRDKSDLRTRAIQSE